MPARPRLVVLALAAAALLTSCGDSGPDGPADPEDYLARAWEGYLRLYVADGDRERAVELLEAIRLHSALELDEGWFFAAGNWAVEERIANPSYFVPYAYPHFHRAHPEGDWLEAWEAGYRMLDSLRRDPSFALPPDFLLLRRNTSVAPLPAEHPLTGDFSFDAIRLYWRVELDCLLAGRHEACREPPGLDRLVEELEEHGRLATRYSPAGQPLTDEESLSFYGALLPSPRRLRPPLAERILTEHLLPDRLSGLLEVGDRYYDRNWVWFGLAVEAGVIPEAVGK